MLAKTNVPLAVAMNADDYEFFAVEPSKKAFFLKIQMAEHEAGQTIRVVTVPMNQEPIRVRVEIPDSQPNQEPTTVCTVLSDWQPDPQRERLATAHHDAGHAVIATYLRVRVRFVEVFADGEGGICNTGRLRWDIAQLGKDEARRALEPHILIFFAGQLAEAEFLGQSPNTFTGYESDNKSAVDLACHACGSEPETYAFQMWLFERTRNLVKLCWPQIRVVAAALAEKGKLTSKEVVELMRTTLHS